MSLDKSLPIPDQNQTSATPPNQCPQLSVSDSLKAQALRDLIAKTRSEQVPPSDPGILHSAFRWLAGGESQGPGVADLSGTEALLDSGDVNAALESYTSTMRADSNARLDDAKVEGTVADYAGATATGLHAAGTVALGTAAALTGPAAMVAGAGIGPAAMLGTGAAFAYDDFERTQSDANYENTPEIALRRMGEGFQSGIETTGMPQYADGVGVCNSVVGTAAEKLGDMGGATPQGAQEFGDAAASGCNLVQAGGTLLDRLFVPGVLSMDPKIGTGPVVDELKDPTVQNAGWKFLKNGKKVYDYTEANAPKDPRPEENQLPTIGQGDGS